MKVMCIKSSEDFTKGKEYPITSHQGRGIVAIVNDRGNTHSILNLNKTYNVPQEFFDKYFVMTAEIKARYLNSTIEPCGY